MVPLSRGWVQASGPVDTRFGIGALEVQRCCGARTSQKHTSKKTRIVVGE